MWAWNGEQVFLRISAFIFDLTVEYFYRWLLVLGTKLNDVVGLLAMVIAESMRTMPVKPVAVTSIADDGRKPGELGLALVLLLD